MKRIVCKQGCLYVSGSWRALFDPAASLFIVNLLSLQFINPLPMFTTPVEIPLSPAFIDHQTKVLILGSCFSENIGRKMQRAFFDVGVNPFGVLYNPFSILNGINLLLDGACLQHDQLFHHASLWHSFSHDSSFSAPEADVALKKINSSLAEAAAFLRQADFLFITFGTAWVFELADTGTIVSNCHKLPGSFFRRRRLRVEEITAAYGQVIESLQQNFPNLHLVFTISPIRHLKDGARGNNVSKSVLSLAIEDLLSNFRNLHYFPAYEIVMDELRDYRFYASDMLHISDVAVDYIWKRFSETYFSSETRVLQKRLEKYSADLAHIPMHPDSSAYLAFQKNVERRRMEILADYPFLRARML